MTDLATCVAGGKEMEKNLGLVVEVFWRSCTTDRCNAHVGGSLKVRGSEDNALLLRVSLCRTRFITQTIFFFCFGYILCFSSVTFAEVTSEETGLRVETTHAAPRSNSHEFPGT